MNIEFESLIEWASECESVILRNSAGARDDNVPIGVLARSRRFAILQLSREDDAEQEPVSQPHFELNCSCEQWFWNKFDTVYTPVRIPLTEWKGSTPL